jgi:hypothetical protein
VDRCGQTEGYVNDSCEARWSTRRCHDRALSAEVYVWRSWPLSVLVLALLQVALALLGPLADLSAGGEGANCALESDTGGGDGRDG